VRKFTRWGLALLAAAALSLPAAPAQAADFDPVACSGYVALRSYTTPSGNTFLTTNNTCVYRDLGNIGPVTRYRCYLNGQPYAGCRWSFNLILQRWNNRTFSWETIASHDEVLPNHSGYVSDSGRFWGPSVVWAGSGADYRAVVRSNASITHRVRFCCQGGTTSILRDLPQNFSSVY
jgi:hypothetical protein